MLSQGCEDQQWAPPSRLNANFRAVKLSSTKQNPDQGLELWGRDGAESSGIQTLLPALGDPDIEVEAVFLPISVVLGDGGL